MGKSSASPSELAAFTSGLQEPHPLVTRKLLLECPIAGLAHHDISDVWKELFVGAELALVREKHNKYDKNAVAVALADDFDGNPDNFDFDFILGYVPKEHNTAIATLLDMGWTATLHAEISSLKAKSSEYNAVKMAIYIVNKETASPVDDTQAPLFVQKIEQEEWEMLHQQLWKHGFAYFRWRTCFPIHEVVPEIKRNAKVVFYHRTSQHTQMLMMKVVAKGDDCSYFVADHEELLRLDDCSPYILTAVDVTLHLDEVEAFMMKQLPYNYNCPVAVEDVHTKGNILQCFPIYRNYIKP